MKILKKHVKNVFLQLNCRFPVFLGGCLPRGVSAGGCLPGGCLPRGGVCQGGVCQWSVPCDLSHHAFDVTCMLPPHQLRLNTSAAAYILLTHCMLGYTPPPCGQTDACKLITLPKTSFAGGKNCYNFARLLFVQLDQNEGI